MSRQSTQKRNFRGEKRQLGCVADFRSRCTGSFVGGYYREDLDLGISPTLDDDESFDMRSRRAQVPFFELGNGCLEVSERGHSEPSWALRAAAADLRDTEPEF